MLSADPLEFALTMDVSPGINAEVDACIIDLEGPQVEKGKGSVVLENVHSTYAPELTCLTASQSGNPRMHQRTFAQDDAHYDSMNSPDQLTED
ncbi:hypothetical protein BVRB_2g037910 [Beta vulgaris subsp. vulgaris]|nr:hypothetical protein BVRB_2g037910 [Beta vulgaris subsp. vulgaris]